MTSFLHSFSLFPSFVCYSFMSLLTFYNVFPRTLNFYFLSHISLLSFLFFRGNCILVGSLGQPIYNLAQLSLYIAGYSIFFLKDVQDNDIKLRDMMRSLFRLAGLEGKQVAIILQVSQQNCLFIWLSSIHPSIYSPINPFISSSIHPSLSSSIYPSISSSIHPSFHLSLHPSIHASIYTSIHLSLYSSIHLSIHLSIFLSIHLSIHPAISSSIHPSVHLFIFCPLFLLSILTKNLV